MPVVTEGEVTEDQAENGQVTYGLRVVFDNGETGLLKDVDTSCTHVSALLKRVIGEDLDLCQLRYLAEDLLGTVYDGSRA